VNCRAQRGTDDPMRATFVIYLLVIVVGLTFFTVVGLTHH
jgi:hypothetical protein